MARLGGLPAPIIPVRGGPNYQSLFRSAAEGGEFLSVSFQTKDLVRFINQETGAFLDGKVLAALKRANERAAIVVQEGMRDEMLSQIGTHSRSGPRPQRSGNRLARSIMDEENRVVNPNNFMVGIESWLNRSPAKMYWRSIEEGMGGYDARVLFNDEDGGQLFAPGDGGPHARMRQFLGYQGGRAVGVLVHVSPIEAFHYSRGGVAAMNRLDMSDLYVRTLRAAGVKGLTKGAKGGILK